MVTLTAEQERRAIETMQQYLQAPAGTDGITPLQSSAKLDSRRVEVIERELQPLLRGYLDGKVPLAEFKPRVDGINKRNELWGFKGIKGQMFFNVAVNVADDIPGFDAELKIALAEPEDDGDAWSKINVFAGYIGRIGQQYVDAGGSKAGRPHASSVPFFLSYFWQVQARGVWPVFYTNSTNVMNDLNLWEPSNDLAENYAVFKQLHEKLTTLFTEASGRKFGLYDVEHVFWFKGGTPYVETPQGSSDKKPPTATHIVHKEADARLPDSYVPPIVAVLPKMARNDPPLADAAQGSATSLERAFEKNVHAAFTILGYEARLLGSGQGRVPDGLAIESDASYAVIWDAKIRSDGYSIGTDDRTIREYITTQTRELKRRRGLKNIYYVIVSSRLLKK